MSYQTIQIKEIHHKGHESFHHQTVVIGGWVRSLRSSKTFSFIVLNDGSTQDNLQVVVDNALENYSLITSCLAGTCLLVEGEIVASSGKGQNLEMKAKKVEIMGSVDENFPLQKKATSLEFLRELGHLRARTNTFGAVFRVSHALSFAIHEFFNRRNFFHVHTPIVTSSDCEGAGEMFRLTTLNLQHPPKQVSGEVDFSKDFYGKGAFLTVSGQLNAEALALGLGQVYTFGPTFRAEKSFTSRHLSEFWMVEPEAAFYDLERNMQLAIDFLQSIIGHVLKNCTKELEFLTQHYQNDLITNLEKVVNSKFQHITYTEAVKILKEQKVKFEFPVEWGIDLQSEHERYLTDVYFKAPVIVTDYPREIKAFYMKLNEDKKTVRAMDVLAPGIGEIIGGSQREDDEEVLRSRIIAMKLPLDEYDWYLQLRRFGGVEHSGFGMGFERMLMYVTGMSNIRDVIPFPRFANHIQF